MVNETLRQMAAGGINDQLGGGFHRYAVKVQIDGRVTAYPCHDHACSPPAARWRALAPLLAPAWG